MIGIALTGGFRELVDGALDDLGGRRDVPIILGSCNGSAVDEASWPHAFEQGAWPIASGSCASGLQALWLGKTLVAAGEPEVIVVGVDAITPASHANFEVLRVLDDAPAPWQPHSAGFIEGQAAVAIRLTRDLPGIAQTATPRLVGPLLGNDLRALVAAMPRADFAIGQGTGPAAADDEELAAIPIDLPLATALVRYGHTVGASGLLSVLLAARQQPIEMPDTHASDRRRLGVDGKGVALIVCRALGGACAVVGTGDGHAAQPNGWTTPQKPPPMRIPLLRRIAEIPRPAKLPAAIIVRLDAPLVPPDDARIGSRLLPSVVLEITPGFIAQLLARTWGYRGPSLCLVGGSDEKWVPTLAAIRHVHGEVAVLHVHASDFEWGT